MKFLREMLPNALHASFKRKLVELTQALYDVPPHVWNAWYTTTGKELPRKELDGMSCRQALIHVSEDLIKPNFGKSYFGQQEANYISRVKEKDYKIALFSDGGFVEELYPLMDKFGQENIYILKIVRPGFTFSNDSRSYLSERVVPVGNHYTVYNDGDLEKYKKELKNFADILKL